MENREKVLRGLYMALDELNFRSMKKENGGCLGEKLDENVRKIKLFNIFIMMKLIYIFCCFGIKIICVVFELFEATWKQKFG